jgi:hypothetical protein
VEMRVQNVAEWRLAARLKRLQHATAPNSRTEIWCSKQNPLKKREGSPRGVLSPTIRTEMVPRRRLPGVVIAET